MRTQTPQHLISEGAVRQDGPLPETRCKDCGHPIVWATNKRTGKKFPVNILTGSSGVRYYNKRARHSCAKPEVIPAAPGTYKGKTAEQWRAEAAEMFAKREESWDRSDTDGFVSQWALGSLSQSYSLCAELAEADGLTEVCALFDLDGELVPSVHGWGDYGEYFAVLDNEERGCRRFFSPSKAKNPAIERKNNAAKGFYIGTVKTAGKVELLGKGTGLAGCANSYNAIVPATHNPNGNVLITAEQVVEVVDNGHEAEGAVSPEAKALHADLMKASRAARSIDTSETFADAAELVLGGHFETARKMLVPLRTRAALTAIKIIKTL